MAEVKSWFYEEEDGSGIKGYMCLTDFECELGAFPGGNKIYPSVECIEQDMDCVQSCGIVEVRVIGIRIVKPCSDHE